MQKNLFDGEKSEKPHSELPRRWKEIQLQRLLEKISSESPAKDTHDGSREESNHLSDVWATAARPLQT